MRLFFILTVAFLCINLAKAQHNLIIHIKGIKTESGTIKLALYNNEAEFPEVGKQIAGKSTLSELSGVTFTMENLKPGKYAVAVYHDVNNNNLLDKNLLGIPTESFGFSSNTGKTKFAPPNWADAVIFVPETKEIKIKFYSRK